MNFIGIAAATAWMRIVILSFLLATFMWYLTGFLLVPRVAAISVWV